MTYNPSNTPNTGTGVRSTERPQEQMRHAAEQATGDIRQKAQDTLDSVQSIDLKQQIQDHPWLTLGAMVGVGYLLKRMSGSGQLWQSSQGHQSYQGHQGQPWQSSQTHQSYQGHQAQPWQSHQSYPGQPWQSYQTFQGYQGQQPWQGQHAYGGVMEQAKQYESSQREGMVGKLGRRMFASVGTLEELFREKLQELYDAEHQILKALPMMIEAATSQELKRAFDMHLRQTQGQIGRLEQVFRRLDMDPRGKVCTSMRGILAEGEEIVAMRADPEVKDAALIAAAQHVEHHEIVAYGTLRAWARQLGHHDMAQVLQQTLTEEEQTDRQLTQIAEQAVNLRAMRS